MLEQSQFLLELRSHLTQHWGDYGLEGNPSGLTYRMRQSPLGRSDGNRMVSLWFKDDPEKPLVVAKWGNRPNAGEFTRQEYRHAVWLYEKKGFHFIPRPIDCPTILEVPVLIEEAVIGRSYAHRLLRLPQGQELELKRIFSKAEEILENIQDPLTPVMRSEFLERFQPYLSRAEGILGWNKNQSNERQSTVAAKITNPIPGSGKTLVTGDFSPQNLIESDNGIFLIDLEFSLESVVAFLDPMTFVYRIFKLLTPHQTLENPQEAVKAFLSFWSDSKNEIARFSIEFLRSRGLSKEHWDWYWLVFFVHEAVFQHFLMENFSSSDAAFFNAFITHFSTAYEKDKSGHP